MNEIVWTKTDESPYLASVSLLPMIKMVLNKADIKLKIADISLASRILSAFNLASDDLKFLSNLTQEKSANIIKLPNISATISQLKSAILELQKAGFDIPNYPDEIKNEADKVNLEKYKKVLGSAVNPVLREGNSDRRSTRAVKEYAKANPHYMGEWSSESKTRIASMNEGDFYANEKAFILEKDEILSIDFIDKSGKISKLKDKITLNKGDVVDASFMNVSKLVKFYKNEIQSAKKDDLVFSLHLKASMMKVSDPVIFGHCLRVYFDEIFSEYDELFKRENIKAEDGLKEIYTKLKNTQNGEKIIAKFNEALQKDAGVYMLDVANNISNFHVSSDVIIDASMPQLLRNSGKLRDKKGDERECVAVIPDRCYAGIYEAVLQDFKQNGKLDVSKLASVSNVGLMAKKAQEYGSHDKTFIAPFDGEFIVRSDEREIFKFAVKSGDIFRMCISKDEAIKNWINLAINRAKITQNELIFWLDESRAVDSKIIEILRDTKELSSVKYEILNPFKACKKTLSLIRDGKDVISASGNVLRDYLTDLFPILELGTSAKMLSIVPLLNGGVMLETGAGGTAPVLSRELAQNGRMIWDSLGEFLALNASLEMVDNKEAKILANALDKAISEYLNNDKSPKPSMSELDTRGSHFWLILYWLRALNDSEISNAYKEVLTQFENKKDEILTEISSSYGKSVEFGGWYHMDTQKIDKVMRPSKILNEIVKNA